MGVYASTPTVNIITMTTASSYFRFGITFITYAVSMVLFIVGIIGIAILFPEYYLIHWFLLFTPFFSTVSLVASAITQFVSYLFKLTKYSVLAVVICTLAHFALIIIALGSFVGFGTLKDIAFAIPVGLLGVIGFVNGLILARALPKNSS